MFWFVLLVLWPLAELFVIVKVAEAIGFLWVLLLLIMSWPIGSRIIRHQGRAALRRLREALAAGREPTDAVLDGAQAMAGGWWPVRRRRRPLGLLLLVGPGWSRASPPRATVAALMAGARLRMVIWGVRRSPRRRRRGRWRRLRRRRHRGRHRRAAAGSMSAMSAPTAPVAIFGDLAADLWGILVGGDDTRAAVAGVTAADVVLARAELDLDDGENLKWRARSALRIERADATTASSGGDIRSSPVA